jgi:ABC-2 type transport system permease protein
MRKALHVIRREYVESARKKTFIISTILAPLFMGAFYGIPLLTMLFIPPEQVSIAVLDRTGSIGEEFVSSLADTLEGGRQQYKVMVADPMGRDPENFKKVLVESISSNALDVLIDIPEDVLEEGEVGYISKDYFDERVVDEIEGKLNSIIVTRRLEEVGLDFERVSALTEPVRLNQQKITKTGMLEGGEVVGEFIVVGLFVMILYITLLSWGIAVQRSIIEEKGSRVIEVMLSSVEPRDLFIGKIIGVGSLGLTQIAIWGAMIFAVGFSSSVVFAELSQYVQISFADVVYFLLFYVLGFLLYSAVFTIVGAMCSTEQDAQQLQSVIMIPLIIPIMLTFVVIQNPNSLLGVVLSIIPLFTPMVMLARVVISDPPGWQVALSIVLLIASIYGVILFAARVFRVGVLMYGKRPSLREVIRWFRYA